MQKATEKKKAGVKPFHWPPCEDFPYFFTVQKGFTQLSQALCGECYSSLQSLASPDLDATLSFQQY